MTYGDICVTANFCGVPIAVEGIVSDLLNSHSTTKNTILPSVPQNNESDVSPLANASDQINAAEGMSQHSESVPKISLQQQKEADDALTAAIQWLLAEQNWKIDAITLEHGVTQDKVNKLMGGKKHYKRHRNVQLANTLIHVKVQEVNAEMVKDDETLQDLSCEDQQEYINQLNKHHALQNMSVCASNTVAACDAQSTLDNVFKMAMWFSMDNVMDFWEDVQADKIARKLKQWACVAGQNINEQEMVQNMQCVCTCLLNSGLRTIAKKCDIRINYANFNIAIKEKLGINIRGWPEDVPFPSPTSLNDLSALQKICDALKDGSCHRFRMSPHQQDEYGARLTACQKKGKVVGKLHKKHADVGIPHKGKGMENTHLRKQAQASGSSTQALKSTELVETADEDDTSKEEV
ncbi:hypothetical protein F4604DRAFT_1683974 [Suillus subluteus]|nr:hypothetical protein F4604DRAFT_1683974 [Suillus subluteus]